MRQLQNPPSRLSRLMPKTKAQKLVLLCIAAVILAGIVVLTVLLSRSPEHQVKRKLTKLDKTNVPCQQIRDQLGKDTDYSKYSIDTQKKLLEKQMICFSDSFQYDKAIPAAQKLEDIYASEHDEIHRAQVESTIQMMKTTQEQLKATNNTPSNENTKQ